MKARANLFTEKLLRKKVERTLQVGKSDVRVHRQALDLVEQRRVCGIRVIAPVNLAGNDDVKRSAVLFHGPDLHGRGMRAEDAA